MRPIAWASLILAISDLSVASEPPSGQAIIDKALKAHGGAAALTQLRGTVSKGKGAFYGAGNPISFTGEWQAQPPRQFRSTVKFEVDGVEFMRTTVVNGDKGWIKQDNNEAKPMSKEELAEQHAQMYANWVASLAPLKRNSFSSAILGEVKINKRRAVGVKVLHKNEPDVVLFFDKDRGLLLKSEVHFPSAATGQDVCQTVYFHDYKKIQGIQRAMKVVMTRDDQLYVQVQWSELHLHEKPNDRTFEKP